MSAPRQDFAATRLSLSHRHSRRRRPRRLALGLVMAMLAVLLPSTPAHAASITRQYWSGTMGLLGGTSPWVRTVAYNLSPSTSSSGTITSYYQQWQPTPTKSIVGWTGRCNGTSACPVYQPDKVASGAWDGSYSFTGGTDSGTLSITWSGGMTETWSVSDIRSGTLGQMNLVSANWVGPDPSYGLSFGSTQPFTYYKTAGMVDSVTATYFGSSVNQTQSGTYNPPSAPSAWNLDVGGMNRETTTAKGLVLLQSPTTSYPLCPNDIKGTMYTMWVTNGGRYMYQNNWRRCLVGSETGYYTGDLHAYVLMQVIDDNTNMVGVVGIEASTSGGWTLSMAHALAP